MAQQPIGASGAFQLIFKHRYLLLIAILVLLTNFAKTTGEFILGKVVSQHAGGSGVNPEAYIGEFYADFLFLGLVVAFAILRLRKEPYSSAAETRRAA